MSNSSSYLEEDMVDTAESGSQKGRNQNFSKVGKSEEKRRTTEEMVELRRNREAQLDYRQLHKTGSKRKTARDARVVCVNLDHGYCAKIEKLPDIRGQNRASRKAQVFSGLWTNPQGSVRNDVEMLPALPRYFEQGETAPDSLEIEVNSPKPEFDFMQGLEVTTSSVDEAQHGAGVFQSRVEPGEVGSLLGMSLSDWEDDPEVAERVRSLGEVLGLARDLNISIDGMDLDLQGESPNISLQDGHVNSHGLFHEEKNVAQQIPNLPISARSNSSQQLSAHTVNTYTQNQLAMTDTNSNLQSATRSSSRSSSMQSTNYTKSAQRQEYLDMPIIGPDFSLVQENRISSNRDSSTNTAQPKSSHSFPRKVRFDAPRDAPGGGMRRKTTPGKAPSSRKASKRGRKPSKIDVKAKLERSRQSARECRARKKLRYQYLEELVASRERAVYQLRSELEQFKKWAAEVDDGTTPPGVEDYLERERLRKERSTSESSVNSYVIRSRRRLTTGERTESESSVSECMSVQSVQSPV